MALEYEKCYECGKTKCDGGIIRGFIQYGRHMFCSWSCMAANKAMFWIRYRNRIYQNGDGNFPSYRRKN